MLGARGLLCMFGVWFVVYVVTVLPLLSAVHYIVRRGCMFLFSYYAVSATPIPIMNATSINAFASSDFGYIIFDIVIVFLTLYILAHGVFCVNRLSGGDCGKVAVVLARGIFVV